MIPTNYLRQVPIAANQYRLQQWWSKCTANGQPMHKPSEQAQADLDGDWRDVPIANP